jgi:acyl-CoA synthetase (NDP forming)
LAMDALRGSGLDVCRLPEPVAKKLEAMAPSWLKVSNPVDYWPIMMGHPDQGKAMTDIMEVLLADEYYGGIIFTQVAFNKTFGDALSYFFNYLGGKYPGRPCISAIPGTYNMDCITQIQKDGKHVALPSPERAARAIAHLWQYSKLLGGL